MVVAPPPDPVPIPETIAPIPAGSNLPAVVPSPMEFFLRHKRRIGSVVLLFVALLWLIFDRQHLVHHWPFLVPIYDVLHLPIYYPGEELEFDQVRSELKFEGGITKLTLDGIIKNRTQNNQKVRNIVAEALGSDGNVIQSWQIDAPRATLGPGGEVAFSSSINAPKGNIVNVNLTFVESKDGD